MSLRTVSKRLHCASRFRHPYHSVLGVALPSDSPEAKGPCRARIVPRALGRAAPGFLLSAAAPDTWTGGCQVCSQEPHLHCPSNSDFYLLLFILGTQEDFYPEERLLLLLKELKKALKRFVFCLYPVPVKSVPGQEGFRGLSQANVFILWGACFPEQGCLWWAHSPGSGLSGSCLSVSLLCCGGRKGVFK